ncbi:hypothetical protein L211DRAFT_829667 [Terfezia boudieri ATCC MYA-4762]|uniref:TPR-like protein n=1 Tax=Terfezia boudieri ATCC MYA-4762 TaxID=1051890 RepID=A0A3N4LFD1_9PEZI|nr:hypothetical protein L211DRAFT_829667 [Terfezia boudieri ATCC MYA-4762]
MVSVYHDQGQYQKALECYGRALAGQEKALGGESIGIGPPSPLTTVNNMAGVFEEQGQYEKGLAWYGRALAEREKQLGVDHPHTLTTVHNMALVFDNQGQYEKALEWYRIGWEGEGIGINHLRTQDTIRCLISLHEKTASRTGPDPPDALTCASWSQQLQRMHFRVGTVNSCYNGRQKSGAFCPV